jgi:NH3-dependent NAD+ synthetase
MESSFLDSLKGLVRDDLSKKSFLLGVSGGSDSMCLANLFLKSGLKFALLVPISGDNKRLFFPLIFMAYTARCIELGSVD